MGPGQRAPTHSLAFTQPLGGVPTRSRPRPVCCKVRSPAQGTDYCRQRSSKQQQS